MKSAALVAGSFLAGVATTVAIANTWPRVRLSPEFYTRNALHFGHTAAGRPALCGGDGAVYEPTENGELAIMAERWTASDGELPRLEPLQCESGL